MCGDGLISKDKFINYLSAIQNCIEYDDECNRSAVAHQMEFSGTDTSALAFVCIELLERIMGCYDEYWGGEISYFCFDLNFGKDWKPGMIKYDGKDVDLSSAEKLWEFLTSVDEDVGRE